ncbi:MAG: LLM class F420-dependent oxidoreductase [Thermomicrobiales bacterium]
MSAIHIGAKFPNNETGATPQALKEFAQGIERLGFDHLSIDDHVSIAAPEQFGTDRAAAIRVRARHEVLTGLAFLAGATTTLKLRTGVLILPQRQTVLVARQAAEVDLLSDGRLTMGVGIGWNRLEFDALGETFGTRGRRFESQIQILRQLWTEDYVTHSDDWHRLERTGILPRPARPIPLWIGAKAGVAIQRAARLADGFMSLGQIGQGAEEEVETYRAERDRLGLGDRPMQLEGWIDLGSGAESEWLEQANAWRALGATHLTLVSPPVPIQPVTAHLETLQRAREAIGTL